MDPLEFSQKFNGNGRPVGGIDYLLLRIIVSRDGPLHYTTNCCNEDFVSVTFFR
jgi:hypothetical protein